MQETKECLDMNFEHDMEFKIAEFGRQLFQCKLCKIWFEELEDSQP